jgi:antirestriction protein ArdC
MAASANPNQVSVGEPAEPARRDFRQEVTDRIINMLENGVAPWQKPWNPADASLDMPMNPTTGKAYRGGNAMHLMATAFSRGYRDPRWMTYRQASEVAWQVRKGEKGTQIEFWEVKAGRDTRSEPIRADDGDGHQPADELDAGRGNRLIHRVYTVFNGKQIEGIPEWTPKQRTVFEVVEAAEHILSNCGATILHDQADRAFYNRSSDSIHLPPKHAFKDAASYYGTALHEAAHSSGHPSRLNRATLNESYRFGDISYAKEELRAELASVFLAAERGIPHDPEQHAAYVSSWISVLKQDKNEIFRFAHDASRAADFLLALERDRSIAGEVLPAAPLLDCADRKVGLAPFTSSAGKARNRETLGRARTTGRGR